jgi:hypothetical protein
MAEIEVAVRARMIVDGNCIMMLIDGVLCE